ncbi:MAG: 2-amino-4-hydroxy-6-hydroxymethyldihydropteridine diphosphokinase [Thermodesulfobacteriota bacterium]
MNSAIIGVGSNIDAHVNIERAGEILAKDQKVIKRSAFAETKPVDIPVNTPVNTNEQPDFLNGAFLIETELDMVRLKGYLKEVEVKLGRPLAKDRSGPRTIDLDIIVFNGEIVSSDFELYAFVKDAVLELAPELGEPKG